MERRCATVVPGGLRAFEVEVHHDRVLAASYDYGFTGFARKSVDLLMRHVGRNINEVARSGLAAEFQMIAPSHASPAAHNVEDGLQLAVMVRPGPGVGLDYDCAGPEFARPSPGVGDGGGTSHARGLGRVGVEVAGRDDFDAVVLPVHELHDIRLRRDCAHRISTFPESAETRTSGPPPRSLPFTSWWEIVPLTVTSGAVIRPLPARALMS